MYSRFIFCKRTVVHVLYCNWLFRKVSVIFIYLTLHAATKMKMRILTWKKKKKEVGKDGIIVDGYSARQEERFCKFCVVIL